MFYAPLNIKIEDLGDTWKLEGIVIGNGHDALTMLMPEATLTPGRSMIWQPTVEDLEAWLKQSDDPVTTIADRSNPIGYAVVRKASRQLDQGVAWACYARDNYTCVYCGKSGIPLTYDHYLAQKFGGQTTMGNGRTSCRKCNKMKGHMTIDEWKAFTAKKGLNNGETITSKTSSS
jgi:hypothetical protein